MIEEFYLFVTIQGVMILILLIKSGITLSTSVANPALFSPISWFVLFYMLCFWLPQLFMHSSNFILVGANNYVEDGQLSKVLETQKVLSVFLFSFLLGCIFVLKRTPEMLSFVPIRSVELRVSLLVGVIGFFAVIMMILGLDSTNPRSTIVASSTGKALYTMSFWFTFGFLVWSAFFLKEKKYLTLVVLVFIFAFSLLLLGGRGRSIWPLVGLVVWASITNHLRIKFWKLALIMVLFGVFLQTLDPILLYIRGYDSSAEAIARFEAGLDLKSLLLTRNFDSFHNLAVIVGVDRIAPDLTYLINGSQTAFMSTYFRPVWLGGVGYPATLPGGLWLAGKIEIVCLGGLVFGIFFGYLSRIYTKLKSEFEVVAYIVAIPYIANIGTSYLDSILKFAALTLPGLILAIKMRRDVLMISAKEKCI